MPALRRPFRDTRRRDALGLRQAPASSPTIGKRGGRFMRAIAVTLVPRGPGLPGCRRERAAARPADHQPPPPPGMPPRSGTYRDPRRASPPLDLHRAAAAARRKSARRSGADTRRDAPENLIGAPLDCRNRSSPAMLRGGAAEEISCARSLLTLLAPDSPPALAQIPAGPGQLPGTLPPAPPVVPPPPLVAPRPVPSVVDAAAVADLRRAARRDPRAVLWGREPPRCAIRSTPKKTRKKPRRPRTSEILLIRTI